MRRRLYFARSRIVITTFVRRVSFPAVTRKRSNPGFTCLTRATTSFGRDVFRILTNALRGTSEPGARGFVTPTMSGKTATRVRACTSTLASETRTDTGFDRALGVRILARVRVLGADGGGGGADPGGGGGGSAEGG